MSEQSMQARCGRGCSKAPTRAKPTELVKVRTVHTGRVRGVGVPGGSAPNVASYMPVLCSMRMLGVLAARCAVAGGAARRPGMPAATIRTRNSVQPPVILADQLAIS